MYNEKEANKLQLTVLQSGDEDIRREKESGDKK